MARCKVIFSVSVILVVAVVLVGTYLARKSLLEQAMAEAVQSGEKEAILSLMERWPCPVSARSKYKGTTLHWAAEVGNVEAARKLLEKGANPDAHFFAEPIFMASADTPLHVAVERGHTEIARLLILHGADVNAVIPGVGTLMGMAPLDLAAFKNNFDCVRLLVEFGAKVEGSGQPGLARAVIKTPLWVAIESKNREMAQFLIDHGANIDRTDPDWKNPLHRAVGTGNRFVFDLLVANHVDINRRDETGQTPLHVAVKRCQEWPGSAEWVTLLLRSGAEVSARDKQARTPLHIAADLGAADVAETLIANGADVNVRGEENRTPLLIAKARKEKFEKELETERAQWEEKLRSKTWSMFEQRPLGYEHAICQLDKVIQLLVQHGAKE